MSKVTDLAALREPVEDPQRAKRVPAARLALAVLHLEVALAPEDVLERPAPVGELLAEEAVDERCHVHAEVRAGRDDVAVDAGLDLALEEPVVGPGILPFGAVPPGHLLADEADRPSGLLTLGIEPEPA